MSSLIETLIQAIIQGITEWLPVSSSGHLVIAQEYLLREQPPILFDVALHIGTLCVVLIVFRREIARILKASFRLDFKSEEGRLGLFIAVGSVPTALIGYVFYDIFKSFFYNMLVVGVALVVNGVLLFISKCRRDSKRLDYLDSLLVGIAQGIAITPGISRSGLTIATGLLRQVEKKTAFTYSFLLSVPAVAGAALSESLHLHASNELVITGLGMATVLFGVVVSMIVGYVSLKLLQRLVMRERFHLFAYYCWFVGAAIILYQSFV
ncbi:MAG: undecaprenyl-diphosphate phosphatase [Candidatus Bathyarchaeota archaeon]|nr:MAG: undecaprenyl-diphosphate phosphatase [Candidatus Bathyarchaeota archaeon]